MSDKEWLVAFDTDQIKNYLFATNKLKEIRGASRLLDELNQTQTEQTVRQTCTAADIVYAAGGGVLVLVPSEADATRVVDAVEKLYRQKTVIASITGACLPLAPATRYQGFGGRVRDLMFLVRRNKAQKAEIPTIPVAPYLHLCDACGRHPVAYRPREDDQDMLLCGGCSAKRERAPRGRPGEPDDFSKLGELSQPPGYLGFIQADGNLMGDRLARLEMRDQYECFANGLRKLMAGARETATGAFGRRQSKVPHIELLLGGDDLLLVTAADLALPVALKLAQTFEEQSPALLRKVGLQDQPPLTLSVGVVLAHADYPIAELHRLSNDRLRSAKQCSFKAGYATKPGSGSAEVTNNGAKQCSFKAGYATGAVDFEVVTSAVGYEADRKLARGEWAYRNKRPYTLRELAELLDHAGHLKDFPSSQLQAMYDSLYISEKTATLTCLLALARTRSRPRRLALWKFFTWSGSLAPDRWPPWCEPGRPPKTALGDLVEILPFIPERR